MTGIIVIAIVIGLAWLAAFGLFLLTRKQPKPYVQTFTDQIECERCGAICTTTRSEEGISNRRYAFPKDYNSAACRTFGHTWSKVSS